MASRAAPRSINAGGILGIRTMAKITALLHTHNDALRIGRVIESLRSCDEILVVDHGSTDDSVKVAREHGAKVKEGVPGVNRGVYAMDAAHDWVLCLLATEAISETLEAALFEWRDQDHDEDANLCYGAAVREEADAGWNDLGPQVRLVNRKAVNWPGDLPPNNATCELLEGAILRFRHP